MPRAPMLLERCGYATRGVFGVNVKRRLPDRLCPKTGRFGPPRCHAGPQDAGCA